LIYYREDPTEQQNWKIYIPDSSIQDVFDIRTLWNDEALWIQFEQDFVLQDCLSIVEISCAENSVLSLYKNQGPGYGHLPPREENLVPWNEVCTDLILVHGHSSSMAKWGPNPRIQDSNEHRSYY